VAQRRKINGLLRDTLALHLSAHCHHDEQEETLQRSRPEHGTDVAVARGCDACYAQKLSFGFGINAPEAQTDKAQQGA
jgi:hypothetical protein